MAGLLIKGVCGLPRGEPSILTIMIIYTAKGKQNQHKISELVHSLQSIYPAFTFSFAYSDDYSIFNLYVESTQNDALWATRLKNSVQIWLDGYKEGIYQGEYGQQQSGIEQS